MTPLVRGQVEGVSFIDAQSSGDLSVSRSELGAGMGHVIWHRPPVAAYYQIYRQSTGADGSPGSVLVNPPQVPAEFHDEYASLSRHEVRVYALDEEFNVLGASPSAIIEPGAFTAPLRPLQAGGEEPMVQAFANDLEATLEIDATNFPFIKLLSEVTRDGVPYDGDPANFPLLELGDFSTTEDQRQQNLLDNLIPPQQGESERIADIVFIHDDSGSLDDEAAQVRANIESFLSALASSGIDFRVGLVPYGGSGGFSGSNGRILNGGILYDNAAGFLGDMNGLVFDGGTERAWNAVATTLSGISFRSQTQKVLILIGDEGVQSSISDSAIIQQLNNAGAVLYTLSSGSDRGRYSSVSVASGGKNFDIRSSFNPILAEIGASIAARYIITYETDNPVFDGNQREVELTVTAPDPGGGADLEAKIEGSYTPAPPLELNSTPETDRLTGQGNRELVALPISVRVDGGQQTSLNATLFYRGPGQTGFSSTSMQMSVSDPSGGFSIFSASIPAATVGPPSVFYYIQVSDGRQTASLPSSDPRNNPQRIAVLPNVAPVVGHTPVTSGLLNRQIPIPFSVEDSTNRVETATLFYRTTGTGGYRQERFEVGAPSASLTGTIPSSVVNGSGVDYYLEVVDDLDSVTRIGTADQPIQIAITSSTPPSGSKVVNNLKVYADAFIDDGKGTTTASGNVQVGTLTGNPILGFSGSLVINDTSGAISPLAEQLVTALNIKLTGGSVANNYQLYRGSFSINSTATEPSMTLSGGTSKLRLVGNLPFLFPNVNNGIAIQNDKLVITDTIVQMTSGFSAVFNVGAIELAQNGQSTAKVTLTSPPGVSLPMRNPAWKLSELALTLDFIQGTITGKGGFEVEGFFGGKGFSGTLGIRIDPFGINTFGFSFPLPDRVPIFPLTPPSAVGVKFVSGSLLVDNIVTELPLTVTVGGGAKLTNIVLSEFEDAIGIKLLSGGVSATFDTSLKVIVAGNLDLLEAFTLATARIQIGNPSELEATVNINQTLIGRVKFSAGVGGGYFEMNGQQKNTLQIPPNAPFIGGTQLSDLDVQQQIRIASSGIKKAEFSSTVALFWFKVGVRLDLVGPKLFVTGGGTTLQVFSEPGESPEQRAFAVSNTISVPAGLPYVNIRVVGDQGVAPDFTLTDPAGNPITAAGITVDPRNPGATPGIINRFFVANPAASEAYYSILSPVPGDYAYTINNDAAIGAFRVELVTPNTPPTLSFTAPAAPLTVSDNSPVTIAFTASDPEDDASIDLYLDTDDTGAGGLLIVPDLVEGADSMASWTPDLGALSSGVYYFYARLDDGVNSPVIVRNPVPVTIVNPNAPATPLNVSATPLDGSLRIAWDAVNDPNLLGYQVLLSRSPGDGEFEFSMSADMATSFDFPNLVNGSIYETAVVALGKNQLDSAPGGPVTGTPNGTAVGSFGDLTFDLESVSLSESGPEGILDVAVTNVGLETVYSFRAGVYFGGLQASSLVADKLEGPLGAGDTRSIRFVFDSRTVASDNSTLFVRLEDAVLPEVITWNNTLVVNSTLPFVAVPIGGDSNFLVTTSEGSLNADGSLKMNRQTGMFEHKIEVSNPGVGPSGAVRIEISGLPADVTVYNTMGNDPVTGNPFFDFDAGIPPGETVAFTLEYFRLDRSAIDPSLLTVVAGPAPGLVERPSGAPSGVQLVLQTGLDQVVVQFRGASGVTYGLEYSDDGMKTWKTSPVTVTATSEFVQFLDQGPPVTDAVPSGVTSRYYRVIEITP